MIHSQKNILIAFIVSTVLIAVVVLFYQLKLPSDKPVLDKEVIYLDGKKNCDLVNSECEFVSDNKTVTLKFEGTVRTLQRFKLKTKSYNFNNDILFISATFSMKSMDMGSNTFKLQKLDSTQWDSDILLPICTSKRSDWNMMFNIETKKSIYKVIIPLQIK